MKNLSPFSKDIVFLLILITGSICLGMAIQSRLMAGRMRAVLADHTRKMLLLLTERQQLLSEFLHDLKSPVASVSACLQLMKNTNPQIDDATRMQIDMISQKYEELSTKIRYLQDINTGLPGQVSWEIFDLCQFLREYYEQNRPDIEVFGPSFLLSLPASACPFQGDRVSIARALDNLISNSSDFTPADGSILLSLSAKKEEYILSVSDTGEGILPENLPHIFDHSFSTRIESGGNGLGLYITKSIVLEHGGGVSAESVPGKGTVITLHLPAFK